MGRVDLGLKGLALFGPDQGLDVWLPSGEEAWGLAVDGPKKRETPLFASVAEAPAPSTRPSRPTGAA